MVKISKLLIIILAVYSIIILTIVSFLVLSNPSSTSKDYAVIKMMLGLIFLWVVVLGSLMFVLRNQISSFIQKIPLGWKTKFVLFCIILALIEEAIAVTMTSLAEFFGSEIGVAYITASTNYLNVVLFHSVIMFVPMFIALAFILSRYDFNPNQIFLLFGLIGGIAEAGQNPTSLFAGFWFFIYGLMVYLPAYSIPKNRNVIKPKFRHYLLAIILPLIFALLFSIPVYLISKSLGIVFFPY